MLLSFAAGGIHRDVYGRAGSVTGQFRFRTHGKQRHQIPLTARPAASYSDNPLAICH
jgi:hypothetical protein